ncbi:hypothetical protein NL676_030402 [Syzygium grande]|nr:hypothetical protein NL676_030402 [Syzygium grande]
MGSVSSLHEMSKDSGKYSFSHKSSERLFDGVNHLSPKRSGRYNKTGSLDHAASLGDDDTSGSREGSYRLDFSSPKGSSRYSKTRSLVHAASVGDDDTGWVQREELLSAAQQPQPQYIKRQYPVLKARQQ